MKIAVIGIGLLGGSIALKLRKCRNNLYVYGVEHDKKNAEKAIALGIVDEIVTLNQVETDCELILIAIPVDATLKLLPSLLDSITCKQLIIDVGSTKEQIGLRVKNHPKRGRYVACHPIAGTENNGPEAALANLFDNKVNIICDNEATDKDALETAMQLFKDLGMRNVFMHSQEHDRHVAFVSHLSHISSFALGQVVMDVEQNEKNIFDMAGSGFASTVRLAKSSPEMWTPIFEQNSMNVSTALGAYIAILQKWKNLIDNNLSADYYDMMKGVGEIRRVLDGIDLKNKQTPE